MYQATKEATQPRASSREAKGASGKGGLYFRERKSASEQCLSALDAPGPGEIFAAGVLACEGRDGERTRAVMKLALEAPEWQRAWVSTLGWLSFADAVPALEALLDEQASTEQFKEQKVHRMMGPEALSATRPGAVTSLMYAKVIALSLSRLLELSMR